MGTRYLFSCGKCGFTGSEDINKKHPNCPDCKVPLKNTWMSKAEWDKLSESEKADLRKKWWDEQKEALLLAERNRKDFKCTTGYNFEKYEITDYKEIVSGEIVLGTGIISELGGEINDLFGTTASGYQGKLAQAKNTALHIIRDKALSLGANALIGIDFDIMTIANNMIVVSANGTAVVIEKIK